MKSVKIINPFNIKFIFVTLATVFSNLKIKKLVPTLNFRV
jgi:hypothetical protein